MARAAAAAGICVLPAAEDGSKRPALTSWREYTGKRPTAAQVDRWWGPRQGLGFVCGAVSGGLELYEFDCAETYADFLGRARQEPELLALVERVERGWREETPGGGVHWLYRCPGARTTKLAQRPVTAAEAGRGGAATSADGGDPAIAPGRKAVKWKTLIETKGEGGWVVVAPSGGPVHPSGRPYRLTSGGPAEIVTLTEEERGRLHAAALMFDRRTARAYAKETVGLPGPGASSDRPGDDFNERGTWAEVLEPEGWTRLPRGGTEEYWCRPGKSGAVSATANWGGHGLLKVFTSSTALSTERCYTRFGAFAVLYHGGDAPDWKAASAALRRRGYGAALRVIPGQAGARPDWQEPDWIKQANAAAWADGAEPTNGAGQAALPESQPRPSPPAPGTAPAPTAPAPPVRLPLTNRAHKGTRASLVKDQNGRPKRSPRNVGTVLAGDPAMADALWHDTGRDRWYWHEEELRDEHYTAIQRWLDEAYGIEIGTDVVREQVRWRCAQRGRDPLREWLDALPAWDGRAQLGDLLARGAGAEQSELHMEYSVRWAVGAVARAMRPGCKLDTCLVLVGDQGTYKSTFWRELVGPDWFSDTELNLENKDLYATIRQSWVHELSELSSLRRARAERIKALLSSQEDMYRPVWGRETLRVPRRCLFVGTTNEDEILGDETGNRRFWVVRSHGTDLAWVRENRTALWAEAREYWRKGVVWWLRPEMEQERRRTEVEYVPTDGWDERIAAWVRQHPGEVVVGALLEEAVKMEPGQITHSAKVRAAAVLRRLGYRSTVRREGDLVIRVWRKKETQGELALGARPAEAAEA